MQDQNCIFCKIATHEQSADFLYEDSELFVIKDIFPKAPVHLLVIPKEHIPSIDELADGHQMLVGKMIRRAQLIAQEQGISSAGYKLIFNVGKDGGQVVPHIHLHVLGGKKME